MLYTTLIVAASAFAGASAQLLSNGTQYGTPIPCCSLPAGSLPSARRDEVCEAQRNTCSELCGGVGSVRTNDCDRTSLVFSCVCTNQTVFDNTRLAPYEQTVPGLVCRDWYNTCINRTGSDLTQQFQCDLARQQQCGNLTTRAAQTSGSPSGSASRTSGSGSASQTSAGAGSAQTSAGVAAGLAMYGTPILAGGLFAVFGIAL